MMPGRVQNTTAGRVRASVVVGVAVVLAVTAFAVQAPELASAAGRGCVIPGSDGPNAALTGIVNSYYPATAGAAAGSTAISVGARIPGASPPIASGDLLLVIQMQDADISGTNAVTYGDGATGRGSTGISSTGLYEYVAARNAVVAGTVNIAGTGGGGGLVNGYHFSTAVTATHGFRTFQVQRRRRPAFGALPVLLCLVVSALAISPSVESVAPAPITSMSASAPAIAADIPAGTELIGTTIVTESKPAPPVEESFHIAVGPITPSRLRIESIAVDAPIAGVGLGRDGSMSVPDNLWVSGWLSSSSRPGQTGTAVIAGHRGIGTPALFSHLENLRPGDRIHVSDASGGELVYEVTGVASLDLSVASQLQVFGPTAQMELVLITCIGRYSPSTSTYDHRLVVFSRLVPPNS